MLIGLPGLCYHIIRNWEGHVVFRACAIFRLSRRTWVGVSPALGFRAGGGSGLGKVLAGLDDWAVGSLGALRTELGWLSVGEEGSKFRSWNLGAGGGRCGRAERDADAELRAGGGGGGSRRSGGAPRLGGHTLRVSWRCWMMWVGMVPSGWSEKGGVRKSMSRQGMVETAGKSEGKDPEVEA